MPKCRKIRYKTELGARMSAQRQFLTKRWWLTPYRCRRCRGWHLTSQKRRGSNSSKAA